MPELTSPRPHLRTATHRITGLSVAALLTLSGCAVGTVTAGSSAGGSSLPTTSATQSSATTSGSVSSSGVAVDPCQVVTQSEASSLAGTTFGPGKETEADGSKTCVYTSNLTHAFQVLVTQASSPSEAQAQWSKYEAQATSAVGQLPSGAPTPTLTPISGLGDRAESATVSASLAGQTLSGNAVYLLKGATFLALSDISVGSPAAATASALQTQAKTSLSRLT
ncbi:MAG TPA: hypothetical protein VLS51_01945 [Propionibacteriaceae bacterium]|nr:hypothetical protein [Propionibacteriaceae bacterium]